MVTYLQTVRYQEYLMVPSCIHTDHTAEALECRESCHCGARHV